MTQSIYVIGGAGSGKSTFTAQLLDRMELHHGPLVDLYSLRNAKALVTLRGHYLFNPADANVGLYLGVQRDAFPGSDGLDRASSPVGEAWLIEEDCMPRLIISEGATLATRRFLTALHSGTDLLLVHLFAEPEEVLRRFEQRGSSQAPSFVANTVTRSANLARDLAAMGANLLTVRSDDDDAWEVALDLCESFCAK